MTAAARTTAGDVWIRKPEHVRRRAGRAIWDAAEAGGGGEVARTAGTAGPTATTIIVLWQRFLMPVLMRGLTRRHADRGDQALLAMREESGLSRGPLEHLAGLRL